MKIDVKRFSDNGDSTLGLLFIDNEFVCYTLEDEHREDKVFGETCVPTGTYYIGLRKEGGFHNRYIARFGNFFHKGMLHIKNVPNFEYILIHAGNKDEDTHGCLLVGDKSNNNTIDKGFISDSVDAYKRMYKKIIKVLLKGKQVTITYKNI